MIDLLKSLAPKTLLRLVLFLGGAVICLFGLTLYDFISARQSLDRVDHYTRAIVLARQADTYFQLAISKGKNFAILKDGKNRGLMLDYLHKAQGAFDRLKGVEQDPEADRLLYQLGASLQAVEFPLGILANTARAGDPPEKLYNRYLKDITTGFDNSSQAYVDYLEQKIEADRDDSNQRIRTDLILALAGALLALFGMGLSTTIAQGLDRSLRHGFHLQEKERILNEITEEAVMIHENGVIVEVNPALCRMLGYAESEVLGQHVSRFQDTEATERIQKYIQKGYPEGSYEIVAVRKDGTTFPLLIHGRDLTYQGRKMRVSSGWDLTEWKKNESALRESQERFERFAEITQEGIMFHENGIIIDVNQALLDMTGLTRAELVGTDGMIALPEESARKIKEFREKGYPKEPYEIALRHKDGRAIPMEVHGRDFDFGGRTLRVASFWDISERKKSEEALRQSEENYREIFDKANDAVFIHELDSGRILDVNQRTCEMFGRDRGAILAGDVGMVSYGEAPYTQKEAVEWMRKASLVGPQVFEWRCRRSDGTPFWVEVNLKRAVIAGRDRILAFVRDVSDRKMAEEALRHSEELFRSLIEKANDVISLVKGDGTTLYVSPSIQRVLGYTPPERVGHAFHEIVYPEDLPIIRQYFEQILLNPGVAVTSQARVRHKDGGYRYIEGTATNHLEHPDVKAIILNYRDVTERVEAERERLRSEENFRNLIERSPDAILAHRDGKIVYVNPKILTLLGYEDPAELVGKAGTAIVHPDDQQLVRDRIQTLLEGGRTYPIEMRLVRRDGAELPVEAASIAIQWEGRLAVMVNLRDITRRKQAEAYALESQERYRGLVESMPDAVIVHDEQYIFYVNPAAVGMLGARTAEDLLGKPFWNVVPPEFQEPVRARIRATIEQGTFNPAAERKLRRLDGGNIDVLVTSLPFMDRGRRVVLAILSDITARKEAERKAQRYQRLAALGEMAAGMAHEIRNPTAAISVQAQYLLKKTEGGTPAFEQLQDIVRQCERLETLVHDTLDYSPEKRFEERTEIPAQDLLNKSLWLAQTQFGPSHARVQVILDSPEGGTLLRVHPTRMERVLVNLILNAFQAMPEGGHLLLKADRKGDRMVLRVQDDGKGFTEEEMARLFEPFYTSRKMGSGLGLAICQKIVEEHGGTIRAERVEPHGAAFTIEFPWQREKT